MNIPWGDLQLFLAIAETGSLSAAARRLRVTQPTVSRRLAELEETLREPVFLRGVEGTSLTPLGESLLEPARRMAEWSAEADRAADGADQSPRGVVRITTTPGSAFDFLAPFAAHLARCLPEVRLEVIAAVRNLDLTRREADLALRVQPSPQRELLCLASIEFDVKVFAAPSYIERLPRGYTLADVGFIGWTPALDHLTPNPQLAALIPDFRPVFAADDYIVQLRAAEAGVGAVVLGQVHHRFSFPTNLVPLKLDLGPLRAGIHLLAARSALQIPRVRAVADLLVAELNVHVAAEKRARKRR
jgi:DNA-binding transcriptional LysR family regulator